MSPLLWWAWLILAATALLVTARLGRYSLTAAAGSVFVWDR